MEKIRTVIFRPYRKGMGPCFKLDLYETGRISRQGKWNIAYRLRSKGETIFEGSNFYCSPMHAIDSDECVKGIMTFLTLRPGYTDREYFDNYTSEQLVFCSKHAEALSAEVYRRFGE